MNLPELPSEQQISNWLQNFQRQLGRYAHTVWYALRSPTSVVGHSMYNLSKPGRIEPISPLPFVILTLVFASLLGTLADISFGVDKPFFDYLSYYERYKIFGYWFTNLQKALPGFLSASIVLHSLKFILVMLVVVKWARTIVGSSRKYWVDVAAFSYLLPLILITEIIEYCALNLTFRLIGDSPLVFVGVTLLINMISALIVYGIILRVLDKVYFVRGWRRVIHLIGYVIVVPILLLILNTAFYLIPIVFYNYRVITPMMEGDQKLHAGDLKEAETLYIRAIKNDAIGLFSGDSHIRLVSVNAERILDLLPNILSDSGLRLRLYRRFAQTDPSWQVVKILQSKKPISVMPKQLIELRDKILNGYLTAGDIPITTNNLLYVLKPEATDEDGAKIPKEVKTRYAKTPGQPQLYFLLYRARVLRGEPTTADARRYLLFLAELPIRIEIIFVQYRALNLKRESETLAELDYQDRDGSFDRDYFIKANREIRNKGYKFPHLMMPDTEIEKLSNRELVFQIRQTCLNYLRNEARLLANSRISGESDLIRQQAASIEEQLNWVAKDDKYRDLPPKSRLEQELLKLLGLNSEFVNTEKSQVRQINP